MSLIQVLDLKTKRDNEKETVYFLGTMSYQFLSQNNYIYEDYEWMLQHLDAICCSVVWTTCRKYPVQRNRISNCRHWYNLNINTPRCYTLFMGLKWRFDFLFIIVEQCVVERKKIIGICLYGHYFLSSYS